IIEYLVNIGKRRSFWSLNDDILKITILKTNTSHPSRRYGVSMPAFTKDHNGNLFNTPYPEKTNTPYWKYGMNIIFWKISKRGPYSKKLQYAVSNPLDMPYRTDFQTL
ncbi:hypothetical protein Tco_0289048, partial [Tanacetum coccineum]